MKKLFENWRKHKKYLKDHPYMEPDGLQEAIEDPAAKVEKLPENWFVKLIKLPGIIRVELVERDKEGRFQRIPGREDPFSVVQAAHTSHEAYHDRFEGQDAFMIQKSSAPAGFGPLLYDLVMEEAYPKPLRPDPELVSDAAARVWRGYSEREGIEAESFGDDEENPLQKEYYKENPTVKLALKRAKKLILDEEETPEPEFKEPEPEPFDVEEFDWGELDDLYENLDEEDSDKVAKVVILDKNGQILLLKRADSPYNWDLPGGHLKKGEGAEDGAERETKEETDLNISGLKHLKTKENVKFYKTETDKTEVTVDPKEHTEYKWVKIGDLKDYDMHTGAKSIIRMAIKVIEEDYQADVKRRHRKLKIRLIGKGGNKKKVAPFDRNPSFSRPKSAPSGFGGS
tara:strand:- start:4161 stop:5357 length:1197 start_codon:yes stop_codon:yes gene_type:complete